MDHNSDPSTDQDQVVFNRRTLSNRLLQERSFVIGGAMILILACCALLVPVLLPGGAYVQNLHDRLQPPVWHPEGTTAHLLGCDALGRDYLQRLLFGTRTSFKVTGLAVLLSSCFGTLLGLVAGYWGGKIDMVLMRLTDIQLAFPFVILCIALLSVMRPTVLSVSLVLAIADWVIYARLVRGMTLSESKKEYAMAARAIGSSKLRIVRRHILPNVLPSIIVVAALEFGVLVQTEAILSFLGLGIQPPTPSWGNMLGEARDYLIQYTWVIILPGVFLFYTVFAFNLLADGMRNALSPASRG